MKLNKNYLMSNITQIIADSSWNHVRKCSYPYRSQIIKLALTEDFENS